MSNIKYNLVTVGDEANLTAFIDGEMYTASSEHPNFKAIVAAVVEDDPEAADLFDIEKAVSARFERLTERVTLNNGVVYFDGDAMNNALTDEIVRHLNEGEDFEPLVNFMENVMQNPSKNSRDQLFEWVANDESLTITEDGYIVGYKGCKVGTDGVPLSTRQAPSSEQVTVNDTLVTGYVPNEDGSVVAMPRSIVDPSEGNHCSVGLHVGTFKYAKSFAPVVLEVQVNPRDVVSVTSDHNREKIRTCRYEVIGVVEKQYSQPVIPAPAAGRRDTRDNHKSQARYPKGHPQAGQFVPKGVTV